jgi:uncharacterized protein YcnI
MSTTHTTFRAALLSACALALAAAAGPAAAHVVLAEPQAKAGGYYAGFFRVSHGCAAGQATTAFTVAIPDGVVSAKPQPKPGWTVETTRAPLPAPIKGEGGATLTDRVSTITWRGSLPDDQFDQFGVMMKLPAGAGPIYFPATQTCGAAAVRWEQIPAAGQAWHSLPHPAPVLTLTGGADDMAGMHH